MRQKHLSTIIVLGVSLIFIALISLSVVISHALAEDGADYGYSKEQIKSMIEEVLEKKPKPICPRTHMDSSCMTCHTKNWRTKEVPWDAHLDYPDGLKFYRVLDDNGGGLPSFAYFKFSRVDSDDFKEILDYLDIHNIHYLVLDMQCWGGGAMEMWRIVGHMRQWKAEGNIVETQVNGAALSAGFVLFASGTKGHRLVNPAAELMWHEAQMLEWPEITTPTDTEKKAAIYRHFQDNVHIYLATICKLTKEEIDGKVKGFEWWINGRDAIEYGLADGFVGE